MNKLQRLANLYYYRTYKAGAKSLIDPPWVIPLLGCLVAFAWNFFAFVATDHKDGNYYSNPYLWASVFFEIAFSWCLSGYQEDHDSLCVEKFRRKRPGGPGNIRELKVCLLRQYFGSRKGYTKAAREIDYLVKERSQGFGFNFHIRNDIGRLIYDPDSKQRIFALLIAACAGLIALGIKSGADLDSLFAFFSGAKLAMVLYVWFLFSVFAALMLFVVSQTMYLLSSWLHLALHSSKDGKANSIYTLLYLKRDLLNHSSSFG